MSPLTETTRRRLDIQGFDRVDDRALGEVAPWLPLAFGLCAVMAGVGTAMASPTILLLLVPIAGLAALFPIHPFDLIYNYEIRLVTRPPRFRGEAHRPASRAAWERCGSSPLPGPSKRAGPGLDTRWAGSSPRSRCWSAP